MLTAAAIQAEMKLKEDEETEFSFEKKIGDVDIAIDMTDLSPIMKGGQPQSKLCYVYMGGKHDSDSFKVDLVNPFEVLATKINEALTWIK